MKKCKKFIRFFLVLLCLLFIAAVIMMVPKLIAQRMEEQLTQVRLEARGHGQVTTETQQFTESAKELDNPEQGFYYMHGFRITDEESDFRENIAKRFCRDENTDLAMIQINLQHFREEPISEQGLANLENLFHSLESVDKQFIIRFLYDWNGENKKYEPENLDIILEHMRQVGPIVNAHKDKIFCLQGLFIGNWGEMNGTEYLEDEELQALAGTLSEVTDEDIYLSVRMPMFYRKITRLAEPEQIVQGDGTLSSRLGLYNDGMLGSWSDYGTYGDHTKEKDGLYTYWNREQELAFQEVLCANVPNGGEVIIDNEYNDLENAIADLEKMHVTYLNKDYDKKVLNKWAEATVSEPGCFDGMDGLTYVERHLGYRLLIRNVDFKYGFEEDILTAQVELQNVGFAPLYHEKTAYLHAYYTESGKVESYEFSQNLRALAGGSSKEDVLMLQQDISLHGESAGNIQFYLEIKDPETGDRIELANEQEMEKYGYYLGSASLESVAEYQRRMGMVTE